MTTLVRFIALYIGGAVVVLHVVLFLIARFYQRTAGRQTRSGLFLVSMILLVGGVLWYSWTGPPLVGNSGADVLLLVGGGLLIGNGRALLHTMTRGRRWQS